MVFTFPMSKFIIALLSGHSAAEILKSGVASIYNEIFSTENVPDFVKKH